MKTNTIISDTNATKYFCLLNEVRAKKVLFAISMLKGDQRLSDSNIAEARHIAGFYDGVIQAAFAKELAKKLAEEYSKKHPGAILTKKKAQAYTEVNHRKLMDSLGCCGLDYVLTVLRAGKVYVANPANGIDEKNMLNALRWVERREDQDKEKSNTHHRKKGLELLGFGDMATVLLEHSFTIANLYEQVTPEGKVESESEEMDEAAEVEVKELTPGEMLAHFASKQALLKDFYGTEPPAVPEGYTEDELKENSMVLSLATRGILKDSEAVLAYAERKAAYDVLIQRMEQEFAKEELEAIQNHKQFICNLLIALTNW